MKNNDYNLNDDPNLPLDNKGKNSFGLPSDYFLSFEDKLKKKIETETELKEFPVLSSIKKNNLFTIPANYFTEALAGLEYQTELSAYSKLQAVNKPVFSELEEDYKMQLQVSLSYKFELIEELRSYERLYSLDKVNPFTISETYFETIGSRVKERIYSTEEVKISGLKIVFDFIFGKKVAFTFGLILILGLVGYFNQPHETVEQPGDCKTLACLERQEILNNKTISNFDEEQLIDLVDIKSLNKQLKLKEQKQDSGSVKNDILENVDTEELLDGL